MIRPKRRGISWPPPKVTDNNNNRFPRQENKFMRTVFSELDVMSRCRWTLRLVFILLSLWMILNVASPFAQEGKADSTESQTQAAPADTIPPDLVRAREVLGQMETTLDSIRTLEKRMKGKTESQKAIIRIQGRQQFEILNDLKKWTRTRRYCLSKLRRERGRRKVGRPF